MSFTEDINQIVEKNANGVLGILPHWQRVRLSEIGVVLNGYPFESRRFSRERGTPLIRIRDVVRGNTETLFDGDYPAQYVIRRGDLLVGMDGEFNSAFWSGPDGLLNQRVCKIEIQECSYDRQFLAYALPGYLKAINDHTSSITVKHLSSRTLLDLPLPLPPMAEQTRIADRIDELFTDLAAGVAALERVKRNLTRYRAAVLHAAVTGRLTEAWREQHGPAEEPGSKLLERILAERRRQWEERTRAKYEKAGKQPPKNWQDRYPEPFPPGTLAHGAALPSLPDTWCWATHDQVGDVQLGRQRAPEHHTGSHMRPYLRVANVHEDRIDTSDVLQMNFTPEEFETYELRHGDILLNEGQSMELVGRPAMYRGELPGGCFQNTLVRQRAITPLLPEYALIVCLAQFRAGRFRKIASITTSIAHLGAQRFAALEFPLPPVAEQEAIIDSVKEKLSLIDALTLEVQRGLARASRMRQSILKAAFEGKLVPQDPADEPASVLLERIRAAADLADAPRGGRRTRGSRSMTNGVSS